MDLPVKILTVAVAVPVLGAFLVPVAARISSAARNAVALLLGLITLAAAAALSGPALSGQRSEERRVGKEC